jgi:predicted XRE-type DNA-binding protein
MSKNVFEDMGLPNPEAHLIKAGIVNNLNDIILAKGMTQSEIAKLAGWSQPRVSQILRGQFHDISVEKLIEVTNALHHNVKITIEKAPVESGPGHTTVLVV